MATQRAAGGGGQKRAGSCAELEISDEALRSELIAVGFTPGPITDTTRAPLIRHLRRLSSSPAKKGTKKNVVNVASSTFKHPPDHPLPPVSSSPSDQLAHGLPDQSVPLAPSGLRDHPNLAHSDLSDNLLAPSCPHQGCGLPAHPKLPDGHEHPQPPGHHDDTDSPSPLDIFISYNRSSTPKDLLSCLEACLQEAGYNIWRDSTSIAGGKEWHSAVAEAIISSKAFLCIITPHYLTSQYCTKELYLAESKRKTIFPVILEDVDLDVCPGVTLALSSLNWIQPLKSPGTNKQPVWEQVAQEIRDSVLSSLGTKQQGKSLIDYSVQEVCAAVERLELDSSEFRANSVDGRSLTELTDKEMKKELKLRPLQIKKLKKFITNSS